MPHPLPVARPSIDRVGMLRQLPLLRGIDDAALADLARRFVVRERPAGFVLVAQDEPGDTLHVLESGRARVVRAGEGGRDVTLAHIHAGDLFGEMAVLDGRPRSASVVALTPVRVLVLGRDALVEHVNAHPTTAFRLLAEMARRLRRANEVIADLALCEVEVRLARTLVALAREDGVETPEGLLLRARPTQAELASMVGTCRETVSRQVAAWQRRGWIALRGQHLALSRDLVAYAEPRRRAA